MTKQEQIDNMLLLLYDTSTYDWLLDHSDSFHWEGEIIVLHTDKYEIPDCIVQDVEWWNGEMMEICKNS